MRLNFRVHRRELEGRHTACGNHVYLDTHWTEDPNIVTCETCLRRMQRATA